MKKLLLQLDSDKFPSVFDCITAYDAGVDNVLSYGGVALEDVRNLVYGAMFTRGGEDLKNTAIFIGGSDVPTGEAMLKEVLNTFFGPVRVSVMADPNGSNTTAAAAVRKITGAIDVRGKKAVVFAGTGPVGMRVCTLLAKEGAEVHLTSRKMERAKATCELIKTRFGLEVTPHQVADDEAARAVLEGAEILMTTGAPGVMLVKEDIFWTFDTPPYEVRATPDHMFQFPQVQDIIMETTTHISSYTIGNIDPITPIYIGDLRFYRSDSWCDPADWGCVDVLPPIHEEPGFQVLNPGESLTIELPGLPNTPGFIYVAGIMEYQMDGMGYETMEFRDGHEEEIPEIPEGCALPDNGQGTVDFPPECPEGYQGQMHIVDGLPPGTTIEIDATWLDFWDIFRYPGGIFGPDGEEEIFESTLEMVMTGTGDLDGFSRHIFLPASAVTNIGPRDFGAPFQIYPTALILLEGTLFGDPDFDVLAVRAGEAEAGQQLLQRVHAQHAVHEPGAVGTPDRRGLEPLVLGREIPHDRLHHVMEGDQAHDAAVFVGHQGDVLARLLEHVEELNGVLVLRNDERPLGQVAEIHRQVGRQVRVDGLEGNNPDHPVPAPFVHGEIGVVADHDFVPDRFVGIFLVQPDDLRFGGHDFAHRDLVQLKDALHHLRLALEEDALLGHITLHHHVRADPAARPDPDARHEEGAHARLDPIAQDSAHLPPARVHPLALHGHAHVALVEAQVGRYGARAQVAVGAYDAVAHVGQVAYVRPLHHDAVLDLAGIPDAHLRAQARAGPYVAVGPHVSARSYVGWPLYVGA